MAPDGSRPRTATKTPCAGGRRGALLYSERRVSEVEDVRQETFAPPFLAIATVVIIVIAAVSVAVAVIAPIIAPVVAPVVARLLRLALIDGFTRSCRRGRRHGCGGAFKYLVQLAPVQPDTPTFRAIVDLNTASVSHHQGFAVYRTLHAFHLCQSCSTLRWGRNRAKQGSDSHLRGRAARRTTAPSRGDGVATGAHLPRRLRNHRVRPVRRDLSGSGTAMAPCTGV